MRSKRGQVGVQVLSGFFVAVAAAAAAQVDDAVRVSRDGVWFSADEAVQAMEADQSVVKWVEPTVFKAFQMEDVALSQVLDGAPLEFTAEAATAPGEINLPMPDGTFTRFRFVESPVMAPELAAKFPQIKTYFGQGIDDPTATVRFDRTPTGFHAQILSPNGTVYIDPYFRGESTIHVSFYKREQPRPAGGFECSTEAELGAGDIYPSAEGDLLREAGNLRTYRLACAATGEYTVYHGGTAAAGLAAVTTAINRVNGIYGVEFGIRMSLVANNISIIYTNGATDPYTNGNGGTMLGQNQSNLDSVIGTANYDIGHVFSTGGGGVANLGVVCVTGNKARGVTGLTQPAGDLFFADYVCHEMGHQYNATHTYHGSGCSASQRTASTAYEPGSGSTIMSYAGICGADDLQSQGDTYFHHASVAQIVNFISSGAGNNCDALTATGNLVPTVNAGVDYTIPRSTPIRLAATGSDPDGDPVTFCWEQRDLSATGTPLSTPDQGTIPLFRSWDPTRDPTRTIPRLRELVTGTLALGEQQYATTNRTLHFRCMARDQRGGTATDDMQAVVNSASGPFTVTAPNTAVSWSTSPQTVTWNVANTNIAPVSTANVNILLSTDGGLNYPITLVAGTANDGSESVTVPLMASTTARVRVEAVGNIFFDISNVNFTIAMPAQLALLGPHLADDSAPNGNNNGALEPGENNVGVSIGMQNSGPSAATAVSATLTSLTATVTVLSSASAYPDLIAFGGSAYNSTPFVLAVDPGHPCGTPVNLRLALTCAEGVRDLDVTLPSGAGTPMTFSYDAITGADPVVNIPDAGAPVTVALAVSGVGTIADLDFRFDGTTCTSAAGATTVGLTHSFVGEINSTLISPSGTAVPLTMRPGGFGQGSNGNNFCQTLFDDDGLFPSIQSIPVNGVGAPYTGTWKAAWPLSDFDGENADGVWTLRVVDTSVTDTGAVRAFSLIITPQICAGPEMPGDVDGDGDVDARDHQSFVDCMNGPDVSTPPAGCPQANFNRADANGDIDVDLEDWSVLEELLP